jgi:RNA polymerase sigma-70 factor (ECF subfamily)
MRDAVIPLLGSTSDCSLPAREEAQCPSSIQECASAREECVREAYFALRDPVYRYLQSNLRNQTDAEDLTQETFIRLFRELQRGEVIRDLRGWIFRVAHNQMVDWMRQRGRNPLDRTGGQLCQRLDPAPDAEQAIIRRERLERVLASLTPQERRCMELRIEGLNFREIAGVLHIRIPTVQTLLKRATTKLASRQDD